MLRNFRLRITLWYLALFTALFAVFSVVLYTALERGLRNQLDETLDAESRSAAALFLSEMQEMKGDAIAAATEAVNEMNVRGVVLGVHDGARLLASNNAAPPALLASVMSARGASAIGEAYDVPAFTKAGGRAMIQRSEYGGRAFHVLALMSRVSMHGSLGIVQRLLLFGLPLLLAAAGAGGYALATRNLRPLRDMAEQCQSITSQNLNQRLEIDSPSNELETLATAFNGLLARLDASFDTMRRFIADASHELRTPVSVVRGEADVALSRERPASEYRDALQAIHEESKRLSILIDDLLNLTRADAGHYALRAGELYWNDLLAECCRSAQALAAGKAITIECRVDGDVPYRGDEALLRRMTLNLLDNAIRYTPAGGKVAAVLDRCPAGVDIRIVDNGIGIAAEAIPRVFERFYRGDEARSRVAGGFGLGLPIVKWIAEAHGGTVELASTPGVGSTFTVRLPSRSD